MPGETTPSREPVVHKLRRCPKCGDVTERVDHCYEKGHPLFPQTDDYTVTEPVEVVEVQELLRVLDAGYHPQNPTAMHPVDYVTLAFKLDGHEGLRDA